jgi:hypothetical protein
MVSSRRVLGRAIATLLCLSAVLAAPARAQQYETTLRSLDYLDPLARSPRLLGMGRLALADDVHNRLSLWDFAGNPLGVATAESVSVIELRPSMRTSAGTHDLTTVLPSRERQDLAAHQVRNSFEAWRRGAGSTSYGMTAEFATLQFDRPYSEEVEARAKFTVPALSGVINGPLAWIPGGRVDYALRFVYTLEVHDDAYYDFLSLPQGDYIGRRSEVADGPDLFTPNHFETSSLGGGVGLSVRAASWVTAALNVDHVRAGIRSRNRGLRSESNVTEDRPYDIGQASFVGHLGDAIQWAADGKGWRSNSEEFFIWSVSAGATRVPLSGSGKRLDRQEEGTALRTRARWTSGPLELGGAVNTSYRRSVITPWYPLDASSPPGFNDFLDQVGFRAGADTLMLPGRVRYSRLEERGYEVVGGGSWRLPRKLGTLGAEFHQWRDHIDQQLDGVGVGAGPDGRSGPEAKGWNVRAGGEVRCSEAVLVRAGFGYARNDPDRFSKADEFLVTTATAGLGIQPMGSTWRIDAGYGFDWINPDFGDPTRSRSTRQQLSVQLRWPF